MPGANRGGGQGLSRGRHDCDRFQTIGRSGGNGGGSQSIGRSGGNGGGSQSIGQNGSDRGGPQTIGRSGGGRADRRGPGKGQDKAEKPPVQVFSSAGSSIPAPNSKVTQVENSFHKSFSSGADFDAKLPHRPGYGRTGREIKLWTNYFEMIPSPNLALYRYSVAVEPRAVGKKLGQIIKILLQLPQYDEFRGDIVTDFKSTLISRQEFAFDVAELEIKYKAEGEDEPLARAQTYRLRVERNGTLTVSDLTNYLTSTDVKSGYTEKLPMLQALNIFLGHYGKSTNAIATIGGSKSFPLSNPSGCDLGTGLSAFRGFFSSVRVATCRILVNINVTHGAFYSAIKLETLIANYWSKHPNLVKLHFFLKGLRVKVLHLPEKKNKAGKSIPRVKTIFGLANTDDGHGLDPPPRVLRFGAGSKEVEFFFKNPSETSSSSSAAQAAGKSSGKKKGKGGNAGASNQKDSQDGRYISVFDYFNAVHHLRLAKPDLPVINVGNKENPIYLPAEVCVVMSGQMSRSSLDPDQATGMKNFAVREPWRNAQSISGHGPRTVGLLPQANANLERFGVSVSASLITVPGRVLAAPEIKYKQMDKQKRERNISLFVQGGSWNMQKNRFNDVTSLQCWTYLMFSMAGFIDIPSNSDLLHEAAMKFSEALELTGIEVQPPIRGSRAVITGPDDTKIETALKNAAGDVRNPRKLVIVILPEKLTFLYNRVKQIGDIKLGVHTVCVVGKNFAKAHHQFFANVALKVNLKLGGTNQLIDNTRMAIIKEGKTMIVGLDVTHPSPGSAANAPSVASMVASIDSRLGQWPADIRIQESRKEMVSDLESMLKSRLSFWNKKHKEFPKNLLIYRDGVSEGQYTTVMEKELPLLRKACADLYLPSQTKAGLPHITIIIVGKRHHTRFYPTTISEADESSNPKNGTVVDRGITEARNWDFFLQSHTALQGTARPAHYYIVLDEIFAKRPHLPEETAADAVENLTHNMCYLFGRATTAVSICAPAYYADIACERARRYLSRFFDAPTPSGSPAPSQAGGQGNTDPRAEEVLIHKNLKDTMFYI